MPHLALHVLHFAKHVLLVLQPGVSLLRRMLGFDRCGLLGTFASASPIVHQSVLHYKRASVYVCLVALHVCFGSSA